MSSFILSYSYLSEGYLSLKLIKSSVRLALTENYIKSFLVESLLTNMKNESKVLKTISLIGIFTFIINTSLGDSSPLNFNGMFS